MQIFFNRDPFEHDPFVYFKAAESLSRNEDADPLRAGPDRPLPFRGQILGQKTSLPSGDIKEKTRLGFS
jgi:hypothetical protein